MRRFSVMCFKAAVGDGVMRPSVEAQDTQTAADQVCGGSLVAKGTHGRLRAEVRAIDKPSEVATFYEPPAR